MNINLSPNSELHQSIVRVPDLVQVPDIWLDQARQFQQVMMHYTCAIREVKTKLEVECLSTSATREALALLPES